MREMSTFDQHKTNTEGHIWKEELQANKDWVDGRGDRKSVCWRDRKYLIDGATEVREEGRGSQCLDFFILGQ